MQKPVTLGDLSEPQPDLALVRGADYSTRHPGPSDILLIIEVAESSGAYDRKTKSGLYAAHGVPEFWSFDLGAKALEVYRRPSSEG